MRERNHKTFLFILLSVCFLINLIQATYTEIISDEAYYGLFAKYLAWGYFDHPPMVALLIKISSLLFNGNLGIRFMTIILHLLTIILTWKIIDDNKPDIDKVYSFFIIVGSICMFSVYGFITTPDAPLVFFTAFFLYSYKNYLKSQKWSNVLILSLSMAGLVYSKYMAVLVIGFVIISNIKLLKTYKFWMAGLFALILLSPHIWWEISNDYPSFKFQLIDRSESFKWEYLLEYIPNQLVVFNPLIFGSVIYIMVKTKPNDLFGRALYFSIAGFIGFFWITAFRGHVEPHWTVGCVIPMIILIYNNSTVNPKMYRFLRIALLPTVLILFAGRILLVTDLPMIKVLGYNGKKERFEYLASVAKDLPVVFQGSFQDPSLYTFFTGKEGIAVNSLDTRKTQFDIWQFEKKYNNKPVFVFGIGKGRSHLFVKNGLEFEGYHTDSLQTVNRIGVNFTPQMKILNSYDSLSLTVSFQNPYEYNIDFNHRRFPVEVCMAFIKGKEVFLYPVTLREPVSIIRSGETLTGTFSALVPDLPAGKYHFGICLNTILGPAINTSFSRIKIVK